MSQGPGTGAERLGTLTAEHEALVSLLDRQMAAQRQALVGHNEHELARVIEKKMRTIGELVEAQLELEVLGNGGAQGQLLESDRRQALSALARGRERLLAIYASNEVDMRMLRIRRAEVAGLLLSAHQVDRAMNAYGRPGEQSGFDVLDGGTA